MDELDSRIEIIAEIDTVAAGIRFLKNNSVDLIFSDIELLDDNSFEIYNQVPVACPIIFTTAYNQFWMNAFESNGIDYLLKPFSKDRFQKSWDKFMMLRNAPNDTHNLLQNISKILVQNFAEKSFKKRFTVHQRQGIYFLETQNITFFKASEGVVFAYDTSGKKHLLGESTLKEIEEQLNPKEFFRLNRSEIVQKIHIEKIETYNKNILAVWLKGCTTNLLTSQNTTALFRAWIND
jgi:DNA-binding LytR/AlgR family response regulator